VKSQTRKLRADIRGGVGVKKKGTPSNKRRQKGLTTWYSPRTTEDGARARGSNRSKKQQVRISRQNKSKATGQRGVGKHLKQGWVKMAHGAYPRHEGQQKERKEDSRGSPQGQNRGKWLTVWTRRTNLLGWARGKGPRGGTDPVPPIS